jgi:hypothetical protein
MRFSTREILFGNHRQVVPQALKGRTRMYSSPFGHERCSSGNVPDDRQIKVTTKVVVHSLPTLSQDAGNVG